MNEDQFKQLKEKIQLNSYKYCTAGGKSECINLDILYRLMEECVKKSWIKELKKSLSGEKLEEYKVAEKEFKIVLMRLR